MSLSLMIKKKYLAEKVAEQEATGTFHERREYKRFWRTRIGSVSRWKLRSALKWGRLHDEAVFLCGRHAFSANILNIKIIETPEAYTVVAGKICYDIECKFTQEELEGLSIFLDDAEKEVYELIKQDFCTIVQREKLHERK